MQRIERKDGMLRRKFMRNHKIYGILGGRTGEVDFPDIWENSGQSWQEVDVA